MQNKRGAAHFEMIISFIFFIAFVSALLIILKPYDTSIISESVVEGLTISFKEIAGTTLMETFLKVNVTQNIENYDDCVEIELENEMFEYQISNSYVTDIHKIKKSSALDYNGADHGKSLLGIWIDEEPAGTKTIYRKIYISPEFPSNRGMSCQTPGEYVLGPTISKEVISYSLLELLKTRYDENYNTLKNELNIPEVVDFSIIFEEFPEFNMERFAPDRGDIIAQSELFEVLEEDGTLTNTLITFKTWE